MVIVGVTSFKTTLLNLREMDENIRATVLLNESKAFCIIEPLHCTFYHFYSPWSSSEHAACCANLACFTEKKTTQSNKPVWFSMTD